MFETGLGRDARRVTAGSRTVAQSLRVRRVWYADDGNPPPEPNSFEAKIAALPSEHQGLFNDLLKELKETRGEAAERRRKLAEIEQREATAAREREQAEAVKLAEQGKYKELTEKQSQEIAQLAAFKERAETLEGLLKKQLETRVKALPAHYAELIAKLSVLEALAWLDANADKLTTPSAPNLDNGTRGTRTPTTPDKAAVLGNRKIGL